MSILKHPEKLIKRYRFPNYKNTFTQVARNIIYKALEARMSITKAIGLANVSRSTFERWMKKGEDPSNENYYKFRNKVEEIRATNEAEALAILEKVQYGNYTITETKVVISEEKGKTVTTIKKKAAPNWSAAAWYLERCCSGYELKPYSDKNEKSSEEIALEIMEAIQSIENSVPEE